jgi:ParB-like chromosome segregation protein Spo0J
MEKAKPRALASNIPVYCSHDEIVDVVSLVPNPRNPNKHPDKQIELLAKIIQNQGWRAPITVSNRSGFIVRGHGRLEAAKILDVEQVPIERQDYATEAEEWADLIADNRLSELSEIDNVILKDLLLEIDTGEFDMDLTGFMEAEIESLMTQHHVEPESEPEKPDKIGEPVECPNCGHEFIP